MVDFIFFFTQKLGRTDTHTHTDRFCDLETESAQWDGSVREKKLKTVNSFVVDNFF